MSSLVGGVTHPAFAAVDAVNAGLDELAGASLWALPTAELAALVVAVEQVSRRVASAQMTVLGQAESACVRTLTGLGRRRCGCGQQLMCRCGRGGPGWGCTTS
jgi:hypothetical protein